MIDCHHKIQGTGKLLEQESKLSNVVGVSGIHSTSIFFTYPCALEAPKSSRIWLFSLLDFINALDDFKSLSYFIWKYCFIIFHML